MVQFVFVHGVASPRVAADYDKVASRRKKFSDKFCFDDYSVEYYNPYWGQFGAPAEGDYRSIPTGQGGVDLALGNSTSLSILSSLEAKEGDLSGYELLKAAKEDFSGFLNDLALTAVDGGNSTIDSDMELAEDIARLALYQTAAPDWLNTVTTDTELLEYLKVEIAYQKPHEAGVPLGLIDKITGAAKKLLGNASSSFLVKKSRKISPKIAIFLGDAFKYIKDTNPRDNIRNVITVDIIKAARKANAQNESLILCGHSMGANILLDMLWDSSWLDLVKAQLGFDLKVDLFLSVGCQLGLFEELKLFTTSVDGVTQSKPSSVEKWWHVYNETDVLSFTAAGVINGIEEYSVNTKTNVFEAHGAYFYSSIFYGRLKQRLVSAGLMQ